MLINNYGIRNNIFLFKVKNKLNFKIFHVETGIKIQLKNVNNNYQEFKVSFSVKILVVLFNFYIN